MKDAGMGSRGYMSAMDRRIRNKKTAQKAAENTKEFEANKKRTKKLENRLKQLEQGQSKAAAPAKPATPENKSQIENWLNLEFNFLRSKFLHRNVLKVF